MGKKFGGYLATYEMAQIDAFRASTMKLSEKIDNTTEGYIQFDKTLAIRTDIDSNRSNPLVTLCAVTKHEGRIVMLDDESTIIELENLSMDTIIEITAKIVMKYHQ